MFSKTRNKVAAICALASLTAVNAFAVGDVDDLFTAFNIAGLKTNIMTLLTAGVTIMIVYVGYKHLKRAGNKV